ncbi:MAG: hypothetical protein K6G12_00220 [Lachnospiraceae bacterium]|nr:hypothetical protein [Lachnospiraceae bacterium]
MILEIIMIVAGIALLVAGYVIPAKKEEEETPEAFSRDQVQEIVSEEVASVKGRIDDIVDETVQYAIEKTERSMDRLSNEKMMAVSEYSDTVLEQINKSHEEVVFLYDMLNDKHENLKETVAEATRTANEVDEKVKEANEKVKEANEKVKEAEESLAPIVASAAEVSKNYEAIVVESKNVEAAQKNVEAAQEVQAEAKQETKPKNKPVPVLKNEPVNITPIVLPEEPETFENLNDDYVEEEWENLDDTDDDFDPEVPELSFNSRSPGSRNSNERILELHKAGKSNMAIAKELGLGIGEVKLVIDLFKGL